VHASLRAEALFEHGQNFKLQLDKINATQIGQRLAHERARYTGGGCWQAARGFATRANFLLLPVSRF
jgi:hypothetical protein